MGRFFNMDNPFFTFMGRLGDLIILNLICLVCCLPIVTAGTSITAMYYVTLKMVRNEESYILRDFFKSFKLNIKQGIALTLIEVVVILVLFFDITFTSQLDSSIQSFFKIAFYIIGILIYLTRCYVYPVLSKFDNSILQTIKIAFFMSIRHLPQTIIIAVIGLLPFAILFVPSFQVQSFLMLFVFLFGLSAVAYLKSTFLVKIFDQYIPASEEPSEPETEDSSL